MGDIDDAIDAVDGNSAYILPIHLHTEERAFRSCDPAFHSRSGAGARIIRFRANVMVNARHTSCRDGRVPFHRTLCGQMERKLKPL